MTIEQFYKVINGDYEEVLGRFLTPERISKFVRLFPSDDSFDGLTKALNCHDYELAFRYVHTLKGVTANLSFTKLYDVSRVLTELLRAHDYTDLKAPYENVKNEYEVVINAIKELQ